MSWKDRLLPASFRGVPFFVESHTFQGGRNSKRHEMPGQDGSFNEDLGKKTDGYTIEAYVLGDNYFFIRDSLINVMKQKDAGLLIHPYLTPVSVQPEGFSLKESSAQGRIAFITLEFGEAGDPGFPLALIDSVVAFASIAITAIAAVSNALETTYKVAGLPAYVLESAVETILQLFDTITGALTTVKSDPEERAKLAKKIKEAREDVDKIAGDPQTLSSRSGELLIDLAAVGVEPEDNVGRDDRLAIYDPLLTFDGGSEKVPLTTQTREIEKANLIAIERFIERLSLIRYAQQAVDKVFVSKDEALRERERIYQLLETQLLSASDEEFQALSDLQAALVRALPGEVSGVEKEIVVEKVSAVTLAYDLFGNLDAYDDLVLRNNLADPSEVTGTIEVIG